jgi:hypothetical protein
MIYVNESWLFMIMEFVDKIVCDWVEIYWIVDFMDKWTLMRLIVFMIME